MTHGPNQVDHTALIHLDDVVSILQPVVVHLGLESQPIHSVLVESLHIYFQIQVANFSHSGIMLYLYKAWST